MTLLNIPNVILSSNQSCFHDPSTAGIIIEANFTCSPGYYCPNTTESIVWSRPAICPPSLECQQKRLYGFACERQGPYEPTLCLPGFYCPTISQQLKCPEGYFCPTGSIQPVKCTWMASCPPGSTSQSFYGGIIIFVLLDLIIIVFGYLKRRRETIQRLQADKRWHQNQNQTSIALHNDSDKTDTVSIPEADSKSLLLQAFQQESSSAGVDSSQTMNLRFDFQDLCLKTRVGTKILNNVTGSILPGRIVGIMGPSGAGKTSFMNVLMGKVPAKHTSGSFQVNYEESQMQHLKSLVGFVPQDDIMMKDLTVRENILHSARMRLPVEWRDRDIQALVDTIIEALDLSHVAHTLIGDETTRGVSGGQRKRVNIGMELAALPVALFLDEPTSGLDATAALQVSKLLCDIAQLGKTVVASIHQPRQEIFDALDDLLLIVPGGYVAYMGPRSEVVSYFQSLGFQFPPTGNPADVLMDILSDPVLPDGRRLNLNELWIQRTPREIPRPACPNVKTLKTLASRRGARFLTQIMYCTLRYFIQQLRNIPSLILELFVALAGGALMGAAVMGLKGELYKGPYLNGYALLSPAPIEYVLPLYGLLIGFTVTLAGSPAGVNVFAEEKPVYWREASAGHSRLAYYLGKTLGAFPRFLLSSLHFTAINHIVAQPTYPSFEFTYAMVFLQFFCIYGTSAVVSSLVAPKNAYLLAVIGGIFSASFNGFGPTLAEAQSWGALFIWELSFNKWGTQAYFSAAVKETSGFYNVTLSAHNYGYTLNQETKDLGMMFVIGIVLRALAFLAMVLMHRHKQN